MARTVGRRGKRTQAERSAATAGALVAAAHGLFATRGYADTSIDDIVVAAEITRGALYHHFVSKTDLFRAVVEERERQLTAAVRRATEGHTDPWQAFHAGCAAFLSACLDPELQRIILLDAPAVLGWEALREIESRYALALLRAGLEQAMADGRLARRPVDPLAHLLLGALSEGAMAIARSADQPATMRTYQQEIDRLLAALGG
jgi:AcrR family transcriptional regulator